MLVAIKYDSDHFCCICFDKPIDMWFRSSDFSIPQAMECLSCLPVLPSQFWRDMEAKDEGKLDIVLFQFFHIIFNPFMLPVGCLVLARHLSCCAGLQPK